MNRNEYNILNGVSFKIGNERYHTVQDFGLITASINVPPAQPRVEYLEIPFRNGQIDVTEITGMPLTYQQRLITMLFIVPPPANRVEELRSEIENKINGKVVSELILDNDSEWHYIGGRAVVTSYTDVYPHKIEVQVQVYPYKKKNEAREISANIEALNTQKVLRCLNVGSKKVIPTIKITDGCLDITYNNVTLSLTVGTHILDYRFAFEYGVNDVIIKTTTQDTAFSITYTEESL